MAAEEDTRLIAQLVVGRRVHCVGDESVMALAKRVLELEVECAAKHATAAEEATRRARAEADVADEREACAKVCDEVARSAPSVSTRMERDVASALALAIRARGGQPSTIVGVSEGSDGQG